MYNNKLVKENDYFILLCFFIENKIKDIVIDQLEIQEHFICLNFTLKKKNIFYWYFEALFYKDVDEKSILKNLNYLKVYLGYKPILYEKKLKQASLRKLIIKKIRNIDWLLSNKNILKPIIINNYFIYDQNYYSFNNNSLIPIKINASYAFGSGYHETTKSCIIAIYIVAKFKKIKNFLDYGTGTGILGICMNKKLRKTKIMYIDNDKIALKLTNINIQKNNVKRLGNVFHSIKERKKFFKKNYYDLIVANILFNPLKNMVAEFSALLKKNSILIISGILFYQKNYIVNKYRKFNFYIFMIFEDNNWITIIFNKR